ncbi:MAG: exostosin family protein, partial [Planctomycetes bacterium]|nr:exostosin family protein [Planctomycetota bacterium]
MTVGSTPRLLRKPLHAPHRIRASRHLSAGWLFVLLWLFALAPRAAVATPAGQYAVNSATSSVVPCLQVGSAYLGQSTSPNVYERDVYLSWTGTITAARLVGYEFNANSIKGHLIKVNGVLIGNATGQHNTETQCRGFKGREPFSWPIGDPSILRNHAFNTLRIEIDPSLTDDSSWGISRAQIEVTGIGVDGRHYTQVTIPSTYFNNWSSYQDEGTWTHIMVPPDYRGDTPAPLLIAAHGFGSDGVDVMFDYHHAAAARGWLMASADFHGEVWNPFYVPDYATGLP